MLPPAVREGVRRLLDVPVQLAEQRSGVGRREPLRSARFASHGHSLYADFAKILPGADSLKGPPFLRELHP